MLRHVYVLNYSRPYDETWIGTFVGVYSSMEHVEQAIERLRSRMGFRDYPNGFKFECFRINEDYENPTFAAVGP